MSYFSKHWWAITALIFLLLFLPVLRLQATARSLRQNSIQWGQNESSYTRPETVNHTDIATSVKERAAEIVTSNTTVSLVGSGGPNGQQNPTPARYAYAFAIWRLNPATKGYKGYLANILIATRILKFQGSQADFVVFIKLDFQYDFETLQEEDLHLLKGMGIQIRYLPKEDDSHLNVYATMFNKFAVLNLTEYKRVMYLDSDVMPLNNLDYLMEQADEAGLLKSNVVVATNREPSNGGTFIVEPNRPAFLEIQKILEQYGSKLGVRSGFDMIHGWGHAIQSPDTWETNKAGNVGTKWNFWAAWADQGFLYYFCKYITQDCTQILARKIINFGSSSSQDGNITIIERQWNVTSIATSPLTQVAPKKAYAFQPGKCAYYTSFDSPGYPGCVPPYRDYRHFTGRSKPWKEKSPITSSNRLPTSSNHLWWHTLVELRDVEGLNISSLGLLKEKGN